MSAAASWVRKWEPITPLLTRASSIACHVPIHTVITVSMLAVFSYVHVLSDFQLARGGRALGLSGLREKQFVVSEQTQWNWAEVDVNKSLENAKSYTVVTLDFPVEAAERPPQVQIPAYLHAIPLKSQKKDSFVYAVPRTSLGLFMNSISELPVRTDATEAPIASLIGSQREKWVATFGDEGKARLTSQPLGFLGEKIQDLLTVLQDAEPFDIAIMVIGYLAMHGTFINLLFSMRRLGSKFWLTFAVLLSSTFAFFLAICVTKSLGVPIDVILLSEGLPFLVIVIGFEKPIMLTKHVLSTSVESRRKAGDKADSINSVVLNSVREKGLDIVKLYTLEIFVLVLGAISGVQGLRQFCFLAAWILFFDFALLFSFYTAILTFKLEINRIKRHVTIRKALEEDGVSHKAAESYAQSSEWPKPSLDVYGKDGSGSTTMFGNRIIGIRSFKVGMVGTFFAMNVLYIASLWFREAADSISLFKSMELRSAGPDPRTLNAKETSAILAQILAIGKEATSVTILKPLGFVLESRATTYPSAAVGTIGSLFADPKDSFFGASASKHRPFSEILRSLQDPLLSRFIIAALVISVGLNGVLFNVARWSAKFDHPSGQADAVVDEKPVKICTCGGHIEDNQEDDLKTEENAEPRSLLDCEGLLIEKKSKLLTDAELMQLVQKGKLLPRDLERKLGDTTRAVKLRRQILSLDRSVGEKAASLENSKLPYLHYDYDRVLGACCENVIGFLPLPVGIAGPLVIDGEKFFIPMATTEGVLVASTSRGCKAINMGGGATTVLVDDGMTRGPCVSFPTLKQAGAAKVWLDSEEGQKTMKAAFDSTSRFARLKSIKTALAGTTLYIRFKCTTGDAMGMNMISKGVENALSVMANDCGFDDMSIVSVSGNYCTDKKPAAINWIEGRGKSVVAGATIPGDIIKSVLKCSVDNLVELNIKKNYIGSAMAGSIGGFNAHAANIVTALFLATGQDPAQNVESSNCITQMEKTEDGSLQITVTMPSIEVGTLGGGTILDPQGAMLQLLGVRGTSPDGPGQNARKLARIIASAVLAGELSLCSALAAGHLVASHMQHNRSQPVTRTTTPAPIQNNNPAALLREQQIAQLKMTSGR